ncbi:MAG: sulfatase [Spirochaetaceae bacterium]
MRVLFVDIDTLRPDHMGCYGYHRNTTPNMDKICEEGIRFNNYYTSDAPCLPSRAALISGMHGFRNGAVGHGGTAADRRLVGKERGFKDYRDEGNFHNIFRKAGMHTASISTFPERHSMWWFNGGLNETYNVGKCGMESGEEVIPVALDWLDRKGLEDDWYLHVHLWDPHTPYRAPESFGEPFEGQPVKPWLTKEVFEQHKKHTGPHSILETGMYDDNVGPGIIRQPGMCRTMDEYTKFLNGYDTGISYADYLMGQVFDKLKSLGIYEETAVIITSDHGENMGELGIYAEHGTADKGTCNIPMIIKWPGIEGSKVDNGYHYNLDLLPTMAELLCVEKSDHWDGESYKSCLFSTDEFPGRNHLIISQNAHVCQRSALFDGWLYIRTIHDGYHLFDREMLFNLNEDPYEQNNVRDDNQEICAKGAKLILDWQEEQMKKDPSNRDPMWTVMNEGGPMHTKTDLRSYIKRLKETGRDEGARTLEQKYLMS